MYSYVQYIAKYYIYIYTLYTDILLRIFYYIVILVKI